MRISDWISDVCSADRQVGLGPAAVGKARFRLLQAKGRHAAALAHVFVADDLFALQQVGQRCRHIADLVAHRLGAPACQALVRVGRRTARSEEHTSELQSLMRISYAVFCLKKKTYSTNNQTITKRNTKKLE